MTERKPRREKLDLTIRQRERLERLWRRYVREPLTGELRDEIIRLLDVDIGSGVFGDAPSLFVCAPGPATASFKEVSKAVESGWGAVLLPAHVLEADSGPRRPDIEQMWIRTRHHPDDRDRIRPMVSWSRSEDWRELDDYVEFAAAAVAASGAGSQRRTRVVAGVEGPLVTEDTLAMWQDAVSKLSAAGVDGIRVKFGASDRPVMLEQWTPDQLSTTVPIWLWVGSLDEVSGVAPKGQNGGLIVEPAARLDSRKITEARRSGWNVISGGAAYTGLEALAQIAAGANAVEVFDLLVGKIGVIFKRSLSKHEQTLYKLLLDPVDGLVKGLVHLHNTSGIGSVDEVAHMGLEVKGEA